MRWRRRLPAKHSQFLRAQTPLRPLRAMTVLAPDGAECNAVGWLSFNRMLMLLRGFGRYPKAGFTATLIDDMRTWSTLNFRH